MNSAIQIPSNMFPSAVQRGSMNGERERAQQQQGNFSNGIFLTSFLPYQSYFISVYVMCILSFECLCFPISLLNYLIQPRAKSIFDYFPHFMCIASYLRRDLTPFALFILLNIILPLQNLYNSAKTMFKRLFMSNQLEKTFKLCRINNQHTSISTREVVDLAGKYFSQPSHDQNDKLNINISINGNNNKNINININHSAQKDEKKQKKNQKRTELIDFIISKMRDEKEVVRVKLLIVCHAIIRKLEDEPFMEIVADEMDRYIHEGQNIEQKQSNPLTKKAEKMRQIKSEQIQKEFIKKNVISFTCQYLKKLILNFQTFKYAREFNERDLKSINFYSTVNQGFSVLNLVNFIIQSQSTFNKMGRYYSNYQQISDLYVMFLQDLIIYNSFIKKISKIITNNKGSLGEGQIKHFYLFITEAQKTSDRLYEYFHNRYYYKRIKRIIEFPQFLTFQQNQYKQITKMIKQHDKELFVMVQNSKYTEENTRSRCRTMIERKDNQKEDCLNRTQLWGKDRQENSFLDEYINGNGLERSFNKVQEDFQVVSFQVIKRRAEDLNEISLQ